MYVDIYIYMLLYICVYVYDFLYDTCTGLTIFCINFVLVGNLVSECIPNIMCQSSINRVDSTVQDNMYSHVNVMVGAFLSWCHNI